MVQGEESWRTESGRQLAENVFAALSEGRRLDDLGLPESDGRVDLRGLTLPDRPGYPSLTLRDVRLTGLDLTRSRLPHLRLHNCQVDDCVFDDATMPDLRMWGSRILSSSLARANLRNVTVAGTGPGTPANSIESVDFSGADMSEASINEAVVSSCTFAYANLDRARFVRARLTDCVFRGPLTEVLFDSRPIDGRAIAPFTRVDLSEAHLDLTEFHSCEFVDPVFPSDPDEVLIVPNFGRVGPAALDRLADDDSEAAGDLRVIINGALTQDGASPDSTWLLAVRDLEDWPSGGHLLDLAKVVFGHGDGS